MQSAGVMAQMQTPLNLRRFWERLLDSYEVTDKATYFMPPAQPQGAPPALPQGSQTPGTPPQGQTILDQMTQNGSQAPGITNESLAAGATAPSSPVSMAPAAPMQRSLALTGAGRSA
jgi:hypothetical protein